jgi:hypothetical protein
MAALNTASAVVSAGSFYPTLTYFGEMGQSTYPTDDVLALGRSSPGAGSVPTSIGTGSVQGNNVEVFFDQYGGPIPGSTTGRHGDEVQQAQKLVRAWAETFLQCPLGTRIAYYELLNEPFSGYQDYDGTWGYPDSGGPYYDYNRSEGNFGLIRSDFSVKAVYSTLQNVMELMGDWGSQMFSPGSLSYLVSGHTPWAGALYGDYSTDDIHSVLAQGSDGVFRIPIWWWNVVSAYPVLMPNFQGVWQTGIGYNVDEAVIYDGQCFKCIAAGNLGVAPIESSNSSYWQLSPGPTNLLANASLPTLPSETLALTI